MTFVDTNVIIDVLTCDASWFEWSMTRLSYAAALTGVITNAVVAAELARDYATFGDLATTLDTIAVETVPLGAEQAFLAGKAFASHKALRGGDERRVLPDFFIGAHALSLDVPLLTRDPRLYRRYFPTLTLITPETTA